MKQNKMTAGSAARGCLSMVLLLMIGTCAVGYFASSQKGQRPKPEEPQEEQSAEQQLADLKTWYVKPEPNGAHMIVWKDKAAMDRGMDYIATGETKTRMAQLVMLTSCFVDAGTKIISHDTGIFTSTVEVVGGPHDGCEGVVDNSRLTHDAPLPAPATPKRGHKHQ